MPTEVAPPPPAQSPEKATTPPAAVITTPTDAPKSDFRQRMAEARAKSEAAGGVEGAPKKPEAPKPEGKAPEKKPEAKPEQKKEEKAPEKKTETPFSVLDKLKVAPEEEGKAEGKPEEPDLSKLTKEQKERHTYKVLSEKADKAEALEKELGELRSKFNGTEPSAVLKENTDLKKQNQELQVKLKAIEVRETDEYQNDVAKPLERIFNELQAKSKKYGFVWKDFLDATELSDEDSRTAALGKVLTAGETEVPQLVQLSILSSVNEWLAREKYGQELLSNSPKVAEAMKQAKEKALAEKKAKDNEDFTRTADIVFSRMTNLEDGEIADLMPFLALKDKKNPDGSLILDPEKQKQIRAEATMEDQPHHIRALQAYSTAMLPMALEDNKSLRSQLAERDQRIGELTNASPSVDPTKTEVSEGHDDGLSLTEKMRQIRMGQRQS